MQPYECVHSIFIVHTITLWSRRHSNQFLHQSERAFIIQYVRNYTFYSHLRYQYISIPKLQVMMNEFHNQKEM